MNNVKANNLYRSSINTIFLVVAATAAELTFLGPEGLITLHLSELEWLVKRKFWFKIEV
jgi:hypothetical protein